MQTLSDWQNKANESKLIGTEQYDPELMAAIEEIKQLKRQLKIAEEKRVPKMNGNRMCVVIHNLTPCKQSASDE